MVCQWLNRDVDECEEMVFVLLRECEDHLHVFETVVAFRNFEGGLPTIEAEGDLSVLLLSFVSST